MAESPRPHARRVWRVLLALLLILVGGLALGEIAGWPFLRSPLESRLTQRFGRPMRIAPPFRLHLLGAVRIHAGGLWIAAPEGFDVPHLVDADAIDLRLRYEDLLALRESSQLHIDTIDVARIDAQLHRRADGPATWQFGEPRPDKPATPPPTIAHLAVRDGTIDVDDVPTSTRLNATFATDEGAAEGTPTSRATVRGRLRGKPLDATLSAAGFLRLAENTAGAPPVPVKGRVAYGGVHAEFDGTVADLSGARDLRGTFAASGPSLGVLGQLFDIVLPTTSAFSLRGTLEKDGELWRAHIDNARVGNSAVHGHFSYDARKSPPRLEGELGGEQFILADLAPAFGTRNPDGTPVRPPPGRALPDRELNLPELKKMDARVAVDLHHVDLGSAFSQPISPLRATLNLEGGRLALTGIDARTAKGHLHGEIAVDADRRLPEWAANLGWEDIRLEDWIGASRTRANEAKAKGETKTPPPYFTGSLHGRAKLTGSGRSTAALVGSLNGEITLGVRKGSISHLVIEVLGLDVAQGLGMVLRGDESLPVSCAVADFVTHDGQLTPRVALVDTPVTLVLLDGKINLADEALDLRFTAKPRNVSPFTLRTPIRVRGHFVAPQVAPEGGPLAARALAGIALGFVNPLAAIIPFIDPGDPVASPCQQSLAKLRP
ncbi:MAG TPA: AsmA family protein [Aromatoleum sp.]|uniref:AsmA family protein n=1 Tax=Aromatoleum sp. TaxID=2307007 RepID=UPI002B49314A|nr:AsmA family protein [Aromatoleum sp.]HJV27980.1 AsmA family protein [Aromatoleum sp.]